MSSEKVFSPLLRNISVPMRYFAQNHPKKLLFFHEISLTPVWTHFKSYSKTKISMGTENLFLQVDFAKSGWFREIKLISLFSYTQLFWTENRDHGWMGWWMDDLRFYVFSAVFHSYQVDERLVMKGCVQWNHVYGWEDFALSVARTQERCIENISAELVGGEQARLIEMSYTLLQISNMLYKVYYVICKISYLIYQISVCSWKIRNPI